MAKLDFKKEISLGGSGGKTRVRGKKPVKTSINLVIKKDSFFSSKKALPVMIALVVLTCVLIGFLLIRPLIILGTANAKSSELQTQITQTNALISSKGDVVEEYAHYTTDGMTSEELNRVDRVKVMKLVEDAVVNNGSINSWSVSDNIATLQVRGSSLSELNQAAAALEKDPIVERCVINNANRGTRANESGVVAVTFTVYLNDPEKAAEAAANAEDAEEETEVKKTEEEGQE